MKLSYDAKTLAIALTMIAVIGSVEAAKANSPEPITTITIDADGGPLVDNPYVNQPRFRTRR